MFCFCYTLCKRNSENYATLENHARRLFVLREHLNLERNRDMTVENYCVLWRWKQARAFKIRKGKRNIDKCYLGFRDRNNSIIKVTMRIWCNFHTEQQQQPHVSLYDWQQQVALPKRLKTQFKNSHAINWAEREWWCNKAISYQFHRSVAHRQRRWREAKLKKWIRWPIQSTVSAWWPTSIPSSTRPPPPPTTITT